MKLITPGSKCKQFVKIMLGVSMFVCMRMCLCMSGEEKNHQIYIKETLLV